MKNSSVEFENLNRQFKIHTMNLAGIVRHGFLLRAKCRVRLAKNPVMTYLMYCGYFQNGGSFE